MSTKEATKRVLLVSPVGEVGGAEHVFLALARHLRSRGFAPFLACMRPGPLEVVAAEQGLEARSFKEHRYRNLLTVRDGISWLVGLARDWKIDLIHSNHTSHLYGSPAAARVGCPEIWHLHDYPHKLDWVQRWCLWCKSDHVIFTTQKVKSGFGGLAKGPNSVIYPNILEPDLLLARRSNEPDLREKYKLGSAPFVLTVARMQAHKGHRDLIAALPQVLKGNPELIFAFVGKAGSPEQEVYLRGLKEQSAALGVSNHVRFLGYVPDNDLADLYRQAAMLVHPARTEGYGLILLEAMIMGLPVIATAAEGPSEIIQNESNGLLVPVGRPEAIAATIVRLMQNAVLRNQLAENANVYVRKLSCHEMVNQTSAVYEQVLGKHSSTAK